MNALQALCGRIRGVASKDIQFTQISVQAEYSQPTPIRPGQAQCQLEPNIIGYQVQNMVRITARDLSKLGVLLDATVEVGANQMHGIGFRIDEPDTLLDAARKEAMSDAKRKAELMAGEAGMVVGPPIEIRDESSPYPPSPMMGGIPRDDGLGHGGARSGRRTDLGRDGACCRRTENADVTSGRAAKDRSLRR